MYIFYIPDVRIWFDVIIPLRVTGFVSSPLEIQFYLPGIMDLSFVLTFL